MAIMVSIGLSTFYFTNDLMGSLINLSDAYFLLVYGAEFLRIAKGVCKEIF
jgi:hypothetical protein